MEYCAPDTQTRFAGIDNCFCREIEKAFCAGNIYPNTLYLDNTRQQLIGEIKLLSYPQSGVNALHIVIPLVFFTLVNVISVLVEMVSFTMVKVDNFCKKKLIAV